VKRLRWELADRDGVESRARRLTSLLALCLQGSLLVRYAPATVADAFCATRLDGDWGWVLGTLRAGLDQDWTNFQSQPLTRISAQLFRP
jgi:putative acyl-CoA dehydrogenase